MGKAKIGKIRLKVGEEVVVITGKNKPVRKNGKFTTSSGKIKSINRQTGYVTVENINMIKKAVKPTQNNEGGIVEVEGKIHVSNVMKKEDFDKRFQNIKAE